MGLAAAQLVSLADEIAAEQGAGLSTQDMIARLEAEGFMITKDAATQRVVKTSDKPTGTVRFGVVSDTHLGHKHQQLTHLRDFYRQAGEWGAEFMLHGGDVVDGQNMHRDQTYELHRHGVDAQGRYAAEALPVLRSRRGRTLPTYAIGGNHDGSGWNDVGANVLGLLSDKRGDVVFLGAPTATFLHGPLRIMLMHPDGGVPYAKSYKLQKLIEGFEADSKPHILLCGHWHTFCHVSARNVEAWSLGCFQSQTSYMKRKGLQPYIGGLLIEIEYDEAGPLGVTAKSVRYSDPVLSDYP